MTFYCHAAPHRITPCGTIETRARLLVDMGKWYFLTILSIFLVCTVCNSGISTPGRPESRFHPATSKTGSQFSSRCQKPCSSSTLCFCAPAPIQSRQEKPLFPRWGSIPGSFSAKIVRIPIFEGGIKEKFQ